MKHYSERAFLERYPLSSKKIFKKMISSSVSLVILSVLGFAFFGISLVSFFESVLMSHVIALVIFVCILGAVFLGSYFYQKRYIETYYYNLTDTLLIIRKGIFAPREITVPLGRIQDVYVDQDIFDQLFGIYDVHISTATATSTERAHIDGVEKRVAEELRELILSKMHHGSFRPQQDQVYK